VIFAVRDAAPVSLMISELVEPGICPDISKALFKNISERKVLKRMKQIAGENSTIRQDRKLSDPPGTAHTGRQGSFIKTGRGYTVYRNIRIFVPDFFMKFQKGGIGERICSAVFFFAEYVHLDQIVTPHAHFPEEIRDILNIACGLPVYYGFHKRIKGEVKQSSYTFEGAAEIVRAGNPVMPFRGTSFQRDADIEMIRGYPPETFNHSGHASVCADM